MSGVDERALGLLADGVDALLVVVGRSGVQKVEVLRRVEVIRRQWASLDHALINDLTPAEVNGAGAPNVAALLVRELHVSPGEAKARVFAAADLGARRTVAGEVVAPVFAPVAAAQAAGVISVEHAAVIRRTVGDLPDGVEAEHGVQLQEQLVAAAARVNPVELARVAARAAAALDPGSGLSDEEIERRRDAKLIQRGDGMFTLTATLTPECGAAWRTVFDSLAAPTPTVAGVPDPRSPGQRHHDALREVPLMLLRTEALPDCGGVVATLLVTMTPEQLETGQGYASTSHGELIPARRILHLAVDSQMMNVVFDATGGVMSYGRTRRLAPTGMRLALYARDQGCTFPDCDRPPQWTQAHHFLEWERDNGPTSIENMGLVCGHHHRIFAQIGWEALMINGIPHWIPPTRIDPTRTPQRNTRHDHRKTA